MIEGLRGFALTSLQILLYLEYQEIDCKNFILDTIHLSKISELYIYSQRPGDILTRKATLNTSINHKTNKQSCFIIRSSEQKVT